MYPDAYLALGLFERSLVQFLMVVMDIIKVAAAVIINDEGNTLLSLRKADTHQGGKWEFPGGKFEQGETTEHALERELKEELGIEIQLTEHFLDVQYRYPEKEVHLHVLRVLTYLGNPEGLEGQLVRWVSVNELEQLEFPDANYPILEKLLKTLGAFIS